MDDWGVARSSRRSEQASCPSRDGLAVGALSCSDSAGETPPGPTGKMPVLP